MIEKSEQSVSFVNIQKYSGKLFEERRDGRVWFHISAQTMNYFGKIRIPGEKSIAFPPKVRNIARIAKLPYLMSEL